MNDESDLHLVFNYLYDVHMACLEGEKQLKDECSERVMSMLDLDKHMVNECIDYSFEEPDDF